MKKGYKKDFQSWKGIVTLKLLCCNIAAGRFDWKKYCTPQPYCGQEICVIPLHCSYGQIGYTVYFPYSDMPEVEYDWEMNKLTIDKENWENYLQNYAGAYVSKEYRSFQTALVREISKYATAVGAKVTFNLKGHYNTSCFIERNGKFVYISHSSGLSRMGSGVKIELDSFLIRTAQHAKDYRGGHNQYCDITNLQSMIDNLLE